MLYAVHTRKIVDPMFGAKLTGSAGRFTFGSLTAIDQAPGRTETELDPLHGWEQLFQVARAQMSLNAGSFAGAMATVTELAGRTNLTAGADLNLNFKGSNRVNGFVIGSNTSGGDDSGSGIGLLRLSPTMILPCKLNTPTARACRCRGLRSNKCRIPL